MKKRFAKEFTDFRLPIPSLYHEHFSFDDEDYDDNDDEDDIMAKRKARQPKRRKSKTFKEPPVEVQVRDAALATADLLSLPPGPVAQVGEFLGLFLCWR